MKKILTGAVAVILSIVCSISAVSAAELTIQPTSKAYIMGDVDFDNKITDDDAEIILQAAVKSITLTPMQQYLADANRDGILTSVDAFAVRRHAAGLSHNTHVGEIVYFAKSVSFDKDSYYYNYTTKPDNCTIQLNAQVFPSYAADTVTYSSSNTRIATVDNNGLVKIAAAGTVTITAKSSLSNMTDTCQIVITKQSKRTNETLAFNFVNSRGVFGYNNTNNRIELNSFKLIFDDETAEYLYTKHKDAGGFCFGFAFASCLFNTVESGITVKDFNPNASSVGDLKLTDTCSKLGNISLKTFIEGLYVAQKCDDFVPVWANTKNDYKGMCEAVEAVERGEAPVICGYGGAHAVVGYKVDDYYNTDNNQHEKRLYYYDCNDPKNSDKYIAFTVEGSGENIRYTRWKCVADKDIIYCSNTADFADEIDSNNETYINGYTDYVTFDTYYGVWEKRGTVSNIDYFRKKNP